MTEPLTLVVAGSAAVPPAAGALTVPLAAAVIAGEADGDGDGDGLAEAGGTGFVCELELQPAAIKESVAAATSGTELNVKRIVLYVGGTGVKHEDCLEDLF